MKLNYFLQNKLAEIIAVFLVNIIVFLLSKILIKISLWECLVFSVINSVWMPFILLPAIENIPTYFKQFLSNLKMKNRIK